MASGPEPSDLSVPKSTWKDEVHTLVRAVVGAVPVVGGPAAELFNRIVTPPLEKRRDEWMSKIGESIAELQGKGIDVSTLAEDQEFIDVVTRASTAALKTRHEEKLEALRNAVQNTALKKTGDALERALFVEMIDSFTELHLRLLDLFDDPVRWFARSGKQWPNIFTGARIRIVHAAFPELKQRDELTNLVFADLGARGLQGAGGLTVVMSGQGLTESPLTPFGKRFLAFIRPSVDSQPQR